MKNMNLKNSRRNIAKRHRISVERDNTTLKARKIIRKAVRAALLSETDFACFVCCFCVTDEVMANINSVTRGIKKSTDVLSFPFFDMFGEKPAIMAGENRCYLGEIVLSPRKALKQAYEYGHSFEREISFLSVHAALHLLGYDHIKSSDEKLMNAKTEEILESLGLSL